MIYLFINVIILLFSGTLGKVVRFFARLSMGHFFSMFF